MTDNKKVLNQEQVQAIKFGKGPLLIIAGAGTGKTTVITERIKYLITANLAKPAEILALTFTEKAALEMEERVDQIMPYGYSQMWISTFHSFCDRILREEAIHIGLDPHYVLMTEAEAILFLRQHLFDFSLDYFRPAGNPTKFINGLLSHFSRLKDEDVSPNEYMHWVQSPSPRLVRLGRKNAIRQLVDKSQNFDKEEIKKNSELAQAYQKYEKLKVKESVVDFSDLISNTLRLLRQRKNILKKYQQKFKYVLVDEFQDTNIAQNELVILLAGNKANLTVVADDDQAIYRWRGAAIANVLQFKKTYPRAKVVTLTKNYRSTQEILSYSYELIQHNNPDRLEIKEKINKKLAAMRQVVGEKPKFLLTERVEHEAEAIAREIRKLVVNTKKYQFKGIALLVRANNHADPFVRAFLRQGIPFQFLGPGRLFHQEEVKDLIAYLSVLYNIEDNVAFYRILSMPIFAISARDIAGLRSFAKRFNYSFFEAAEQIDKILVSQKGCEQIKKAVAMVNRHLKLMAKETAGQILYYFLEDSGILRQFTNFTTVKDEQRANNMAKFFDKLKTYEVDHENAGVEAVVDWINLKMELGESPLAADTDWTQENKVNILTLHSAKGLEFPVVFLVNLVNDRFPTRERREQIPIPEALIKEVLPEGDYHEQEERRLFYVGMTRARDLLYFTAAKFYGEGKRIKKISPFVYEALGKQVSNGATRLPARQVEQWSNQLSIFDFKPIKESPTTNHQPLITKITYVSYSQLETFKRCPLEYKFKYILGIPIPTSAAAAYGTSVHLALRDFYTLVKEGHQPTKDQLLKFLADSWQKEGYTSKAHEKKMYQRAQESLAMFFNKGYKKSDHPLALEQPFIIKPFFSSSLRGAGATKQSPEIATLSFDKLRIAHNDWSDLKIGGRLDRVDQLENNTFEIIDYKTGKVPTQKAVDKDMQMSIYALAAIDRGIYYKNLNKVILSFYFLEKQQKISTVRTLTDLAKAKEEIKKTVAEIEKSDFLPTSGRHCDFCPYRLLCPSWQ